MSTSGSTYLFLSEFVIFVGLQPSSDRDPAYASDPVCGRNRRYRGFFFVFNELDSTGLYANIWR